MSLTVRTWLRYVVPLTLLSLIALAPLWYVALRSPAAPDVAHARVQVRVAWLLAGLAWTGQLWLVAGVAPVMRGVARGARLSQWRALTAGARSLVRGFIPCAIAIAAITIGGVALVVPGLWLLVLLSLTGASDDLAMPPPAPHADSIAIVRTRVTFVAWLVASIIAVDLAIAYGAQLLFVPSIAKKVSAAKLLPVRTFVRVTALGLVVVSPLAACALAATYERFRSRAS